MAKIATTQKEVDVHNLLLRKVITDPSTVSKMDSYIRLHGESPMADPYLKAAQVHFIQEKYRAKHKAKVKANFADNDDFNAYVNTREFQGEQELAVEEMEKQNGFLGFDDEETQHFLPLIMAAGAKLLSNPKVRGVISGIGKKIGDKLFHHKNQSRAAQQAQDNASLEAKKAAAINAGIPADVVAQVAPPSISGEELMQLSQSLQESSDKSTGDMVRAFKAMLAQQKSFTGEPATHEQAKIIAQQVVDKHKTNAQKALDSMTDAMNQYKANQTQSALGKNLPLIVILAVGLVLLGRMF